MKKTLEEFKSFALKGNVLDLAVGVIIGGAFGTIVQSVVKDIITPLIGLAGGQPDFSKITLGPIMIGNFINALISFIILAAVVFFVIVKPASRLMPKPKKIDPQGPPPATLDDVVKAIKDLKA